jgi:hypothetical protein
MQPILSAALVVSSLGLLSGPAQAARYTAKSDGVWSNKATWGGTGPPGNGDVVAVKDGVTLTVNDARVVGMSGGNGTVAIDLGNAGSLIIASGGTLQVRGDIVYSTRGGSNTAKYMTVQGGGILEWDSSASTPTTTQYTAHPDAAYGFRPFVTAGTAASHAIVRSNPGGGNGYWRLDGVNVGGGYILQYTDFLRIGDAAHPAFAIKPLGDHHNLTPWDATHNTFTSCGLAPGGGDVGGEAVWRHNYNVHSGSLGPEVMVRGGSVDTSPLCTAIGTPAGCLSAGIRELIGNVFDIKADSNFDATDFNIRSNYFADKLGICISCAQIHKWASFQNNFYRVFVSNSEFIYLMGDSRDNLWFLDEPVSNNPHGPATGAGSSQTMSGEILDHGGQIIAQVSAFFIIGGSKTPNKYAIKNSILLPNAAGNSSFWLASLLMGDGATHTVAVDHNTAMVSNVFSGVGVYTAHATNPPNFAGQLTSFRNNILWNPAPRNQTYKLMAYQHHNLDVCAPANCDYNDGFNTATDGNGFKNAGRGYADNFSSTPGAHDLSVDPEFFDPSRNTATFDTAYLGNTQPAWNKAGKYNVGDMVSSADPAVYNNATVNYRYTNATGCSSADPKPGLPVVLSRACWEWASLYRIRQGIAKQTQFNDPAIGVQGGDIISALVHWIRAGFSPTNQALAHAGNDGQFIGAVPPTSAPRPRR